MPQFRLGLAVVGLIVAVAGVLRDDRRLVWVAIVAIGLSIAIRMWLRRTQPPA